MIKKTIVAVAVLLATAVCGVAGHAEAQAWSEANTPGFFGGYGHFGGYYDTFGEYGGHSGYNGYVRTEGQRLGTVAFLTVPLSRRATAKVRHVYISCNNVKLMARRSGHAARKARHAACQRFV